jgi:acyl carrier protein
MEEVHAVLVRSALSAHLGLPRDFFGNDQDLTADLGLDPLDLVMVALHLEEAVGIEFPVALLEEADTVGDIVALVRIWLGGLPSVRRATAQLRSGERAKARARARSRMRPMSALRRAWRPEVRSFGGRHGH